MRKNQDRQLSRRLICILLLSLPLLNQAHAGESWKRPLAEKAEIIEAGIQKRHNILGPYPPMVEIPFDRGGLRGVRPFLIPLGLEYLRFLIKVAQTAYQTEAIHEVASVSHMNPRKSALVCGLGN